MLLLGRVLGGVATSLLFTAFESWLVSEHNRRGFDGAWLAGTFSKAVFLGNGLVAILAGLLANTLVTGAGLGPTAPFDAAAVCLCVGAAIIGPTWSENYGASKASPEPALEAGEPPAAAPRGFAAFVAGLAAQFRHAWAAIRGDPKVGLLGAMQSLFEASMYSFVFLWTPALSPEGEDLPHGMIFATFMLSSMLGSSVAARLLARTDTRPEQFMVPVFTLAACALAVPVAVAALRLGEGPEWLRLLTGARPGGMTLGGQVQFLAFNLFEGCVGLFWPCMMKMRAQYVPEDVRSTIMNVFRIPLNLFVCVILFNVALFPHWLMFSMCALFLLAAAAAQRKLERLTRPAALAPAEGMKPWMQENEGRA